MNKTALTAPRKRASLPDDILLTFLMTFVFAAFSYEERITEGFMRIFGILIFAAFIMTWILTAVKNGTEKKIGFAVYSAACWLVPQLIIVLFYHGPQVFRHSVFLYTLSEFSAFFSTRPAELLASYSGVNTEMSMVIILLVIFGSFFSGLAYTKGKESNNQG